MEVFLFRFLDVGRKLLVDIFSCFPKNRAGCEDAIPLRGAEAIDSHLERDHHAGDPGEKSAKSGRSGLRDLDLDPLLAQKWFMGFTIKPTIGG